MGLPLRWRSMVFIQLPTILGRMKFESMGEEGFNHGMTPQFLKRIRELEKENLALKQIVAEKELENKLKGELLKKKQALEKRKRSQPGISTKA